MSNLPFYYYIFIGLLFVWSGVVRTGLGFGGAVLSLPFLLLMVEDPVVFLPIISIHLLLFSSLTVYQNYRKASINIGDPSTVNNTASVDWHYLKRALVIMIIPKLIGVLGLVTLNSTLLSAIIFCIISAYSLSYIFNKPFTSHNAFLDVGFLILGGYISGTSLIGAPLIVAVFSKHVAKHKLRDTLFVLWFILVSIKMASFIIVGIDLQLTHQLWLLPCATIGHFIGLKLHDYLQQADPIQFYRVLGFVLIVTSFAGLLKTIMG